MSRAYRKWKEDIKAYRRGELPECEHDCNILLTDTSMAAYMKIRRVRQRELKRTNKTRQRFKEGIIRWLSIFLPLYTEWQRNQTGNLQQVSEAERIRQANEYWRQKNDLH